ncbi:MAG: hypothetical protein ACYDGS_09180 [Thermoleophilia bacterium]
MVMIAVSANFAFLFIAPPLIDLSTDLALPTWYIQQMLVSAKLGYAASYEIAFY